MFLVNGYTIYINLARHFGSEIYGIYSAGYFTFSLAAVTEVAGIPTAVQKYEAESN